MKSSKILCTNKYEINKKKHAMLTQYIDEAIFHFNQKYSQVSNILNEMRNDFLKQMNIIVSSIDKKIEFITPAETRNSKAIVKDSSNSTNCKESKSSSVIGAVPIPYKVKPNPVPCPSELDKGLLLISKITQHVKGNQLSHRSNIKKPIELKYKYSKSFLEHKNTLPNGSLGNSKPALQNNKNINKALAILLESKYHLLIK